MVVHNTKCPDLVLEKYFTLYTTTDTPSTRRLHYRLQNATCDDGHVQKAVNLKIRATIFIW